jgi:hypothetical protein
MGGVLLGMTDFIKNITFLSVLLGVSDLFAHQNIREQKFQNVPFSIMDETYRYNDQGRGHLSTPALSGIKCTGM